MISTYLGNITIVLKFPLTNAASTNGRHIYSGRGLGTVGEGGSDLGTLAVGGAGGGMSVAEENDAEVGVDGFERLDAAPRWTERVIDRL
jgi:hypothetical protein